MFHSKMGNTDLIQGKRGTQQYFHRPHMRNSSGRRRVEHTGRGQPGACGPRWRFPRWFQVPWLVLDLREKLKSSKCLNNILSNAFRILLYRIQHSIFEDKNLQGIFCRGKLRWAKDGSAMGIWKTRIWNWFSCCASTWRGVISSWGTK